MTARNVPMTDVSKIFEIEFHNIIDVLDRMEEATPKEMDEEDKSLLEAEKVKIADSIDRMDNDQKMKLLYTLLLMMGYIATVKVGNSAAVGLARGFMTELDRVCNDKLGVGVNLAMSALLSKPDLDEEYDD